tara:strand:+ start:1460 stop:2080 length:621 start_codon:yes stop_codon:yes gene_type:complete
MYKSETQDFQKPLLKIQPLEEIKPDVKPDVNSLVNELKELDDAPASQEDNISIEDKYIELPKKRKKRKASQKQLDHLAKIREKSRLARKAKKKARSELSDPKNIQIKNDSINENIVMQSSDNKNIIDYDLLTNKIFEKFKNNNMFNKIEKTKIEKAKVENPKQVFKNVEQFIHVEKEVKPKIVNKRHEALLKHFRENRNRRRKGWM